MICLYILGGLAGLFLAPFVALWLLALVSFLIDGTAAKT